MVRPRCHYLNVKVLPIRIPLKILKEDPSPISRISSAILRLPKAQGGMAIPDAIRYYNACHLARAVACCKQSYQKQWVQVKQAAVPFPLASLPWCTEKVPKSIQHHPTIGTTWEICKKIFPLPNSPPQYLP